MMGVKIRKLVMASRSNLNGNNTYMHIKCLMQQKNNQKTRLSRLLIIHDASPSCQSITCQPVVSSGSSLGEGLVF